MVNSTASSCLTSTKSLSDCLLLVVCTACGLVFPGTAPQTTLCRNPLAWEHLQPPNTRATDTCSRKGPAPTVFQHDTTTHLFYSTRQPVPGESANSYETTWMSTEVKDVIFWLIFQEISTWKSQCHCVGTSSAGAAQWQGMPFPVCTAVIPK